MSSHRPSGFILRARVVLPVSSRPIDNGAVFVSGDRIAAVGAFGDIDAPANTPVQDLGEVVLMPGLVNAHCHLEYTGMAGLTPAGDTFADWLRRIIRLKASWTRDQFLQSWRDGAVMLLKSGTTSVGDIVSDHSLLAEVWDDAPLRVTPFLELTGLLGGRPAGEILDSAMRTVDSLCPDGDEIGLSPHSLYSTARGLSAMTAGKAAEEGLSTTMHLAESDEEFEMFENGGGALHDWLREIGRDMSDCGGRSPVEAAQDLGLLKPDFLAAHVNRLVRRDAGLLAASVSRVVHCPGSHVFFSHSPFPYHELVKAGVKVCLGTDSLASVDGDGDRPPRLNLFDEMRRFAAAFPDVAPEEIVRMGTMNGAYALGVGRVVGELGRGSAADCIAVTHEGALEAAHEAVVHQTDRPERVMVAGHWFE